MRNQNQSPLNAQYSTLIESYLEKCQAEGNNEWTLSFKKKSCEEFFLEMVSLGKDLSTLDAATVGHISVNKVNRNKWHVYRMFLPFLFERGDISRDLSIIVPRYRERQPLPAVYTVAEIRRIESSIDRTTPRGKMDYAIVLLASRMGLRRSDIVNLTFSSIDFKCDRLRMIQKKNGAELDLLLVAPVKEALIEYLNAYGISEMIGKVFPSIDPMYVSLLVTKQMKSSGIAINGRRKGPHALRSSLATSMVNDDISYETIRHILGHQDHDTVRKYAKLDIEKLRKCALEVPEPTGSYKRALEGGGFYD